MRRTLSLCLLVVSCVLSVAEAGQANRCRRACRAAVDDCVATTHRRRACRKQLIRACRQHGAAACDITPATTTTSPVLPTTSSTSTTTTTTSVTTTLPVRDYSGAWTFVGTLAEDSCGASPGLTETFVISQSGTALEVTVYYVDSLRPILPPTLIALSAVKFALVVMFYMHLKFDHPIFTGLFLFGLATALFTFVGFLALFGFVTIFH